MDILYRFACELRDALGIAMHDAGAPPLRLSLSPTPMVPMDICCSEEDECEGDGQAWVHLIRARPKAPNRNLPCGGETEVQFVIGIARCAHTITEEGAPTGEELDEDTAKLYRDYRIMRRAIQGIWAPEMRQYGMEKDDWRLGDYNVHVVRGGCMASSHEVFVDFSCLPYDLEN
jgi:hypothetical protein